MMDRSVSLETLYGRFDAIAEGRAPRDDSSAAHRAVLTRLADNRARAEASGWTACALERIGGTGRLYLEGTLPSGHGRDVVPDWLGAADPAPLPSDAGALVSELVPSAEAATRVHHVALSSEAEGSWHDDGGQ